jgi:hypothetical protein
VTPAKKDDEVTVVTPVEPEAVEVEAEPEPEPNFDRNPDGFLVENTPENLNLVANAPDEAAVAEAEAKVKAAEVALEEANQELSDLYAAQAQTVEDEGEG